MPYDSAAAKAEALDNSRLLDVHRWSGHPKVNQAVDAIYEELKVLPEFEGYKNLRKKHIKVLILDLWLNYIANKERYIAYSRNKNDYKGKSRYNKLYISYLTVHVVDALERCGYVEHYKGFYDRETKIGRFSRMRATKKLIKLIQQRYDIPIKAVKHFPTTECIILKEVKDGKKVYKEYQDTTLTNRMRRQLRNYNQLLERTDIMIPDAPPEGIPSENGTHHIVPDPHQKFVRRIFNNASWDDGGRFYGGWWQRIPRDWRQRIVVGKEGNGVVELDYSGIHIALLYALEGIDYWQDVGMDPYQLENFEVSDRMRSLMKLVLLIIINADSRQGAIKAIIKKINTNKEEYGWVHDDQISIKEIIDAFVARHTPIGRYFYSNIGIKLQNIDSQMASQIIEHFTTRNIVVLCVHDSFIIQAGYENELRNVMINAMKDVTFEVSDGRICMVSRIN